MLPSKNATYSSITCSISSGRLLMEEPLFDLFDLFELFVFESLRRFLLTEERVLLAGPEFIIEVKAV